MNLTALAKFDGGGHFDFHRELAERTLGKAAPIFMSIQADEKETTIRLPKEVAQAVRDALDPDSAWEVL